MALRVCIEDGCPTLTKATRCADHERARDRARGTPQQRGYGTPHTTLRAAWRRRINNGEIVTCWRCGEPISNTQPWDLGHCDNDRTQYHGPEHAACNRATNGRTHCTHESHQSHT